MGIPRVEVLSSQTSVIELHKANTSLHQAARHEALLAKWCRSRIVESIELFDRLRFSGKIDCVWGATLHAIRQFIGGDTCSQLRTIGILLQVQIVELGQ